MRSTAELNAAIRDGARVVSVVNLGSRHARRVATSVPGQLRRSRLTSLAELTVVEPSHLPAALGRAMELCPDLLIVGGGDGTVSAAADLLADRDVALGVLPLGTTNNFARSLDVPLHPRAALRTIAAGQAVEVDLGCITDASGERLFANLTSVGLSVSVADRAQPTLKRLFGRSAYALTALRVLPRHRPFRVTLTSPDGTETFCTHQLNIANGRFHAGFAIAHDASVDDRQLVVYRLGEHSRTDVARAMLSQLLHGERRSLAAGRYLRAGRVDLVTDPPLPVDVDGEIWGHTPVTVTTRPKALRVMVGPAR